MPFTIGGDWIPAKNENSPSKKVKIMKERRKGKWVTLVLNLEIQNLKELTRFLKRECHCGGSHKEGVIELQGDLDKDVLKALKKYSQEDLNL